MTLEQLYQWQDWTQDYCDEKCIDYVFQGCENDDGSISVEVHDVYGFTDFDILRKSLDAVGVDCSNAEEYTGDFDYIINLRRVRGRLYGFNIPMTK